MTTTVCLACGVSVAHAQDFNRQHVCPKLGQQTGNACPDCSLPLVYRSGKYATFQGCSNFPRCHGKIGAPRGNFALRPSPPPIPVEPEPIMIEPAYQSPPPVPQSPSPIPAPADSGALGGALWGALGPTIQAYVDLRAREIAAQVVATSGKVAEVVWKTPEGAVKAHITGGHKDATRVMELIRMGFNNILLVGPSGSGKTTIASDVAKGLGKKLHLISCQIGTTEAAFIGRAAYNTSEGTVRWSGAPCVDAYEGGDVICIDEVDSLDAGVACVLNSMLANGHFPLPLRSENPSATRHADTVIIATANTYGVGATRQYVGRNQLDAATLNRFTGAVITVDYDRELERALCDDDRVCACVWLVREKATESGLRRIVGTRDLLAVRRWVNGGHAMSKALNAVFGTDAGWTKDEQTKVGIA